MSEPITVGSEEFTEFVPERQNLVIVRAGSSSRHLEYCGDLANQNFDLALSWFEQGHPADRGLDYGVQFIHDGRGDTKGLANNAINGIQRMMRECDEIFDAYDYVCFAYDDIVTDGPTISRMFDICHRLDLDVAHPAIAIADDSFNHDPISAVHTPFKLRFTNFVDWNFTIVSKRIRTQLFAPLKGAYSAHGLPHLWGKMVEMGAMAIIDETPVTHSRPTNRRGLIPAGAPLSGRNLARYSNVGALFYLTYGGFLQDGSFVSMGDNHRGSERVLELVEASAPDILRSLHQLPTETAERRLGKYLAGHREFVHSLTTHQYVAELLRERLYHLGIMV